MRSQSYYVYVVASRTRRLYTGVTRDIVRRVWQHRTGRGRADTPRYAINRFVYDEATTDVRSAIAREKQIKAWTRAKRVQLIERQNAGWEDLAAPWLPRHSGE